MFFTFQYQILAKFIVEKIAKDWQRKKPILIRIAALDKVRLLSLSR